jgi:hypothetical protein
MEILLGAILLFCALDWYEHSTLVRDWRRKWPGRKRAWRTRYKNWRRGRA